MAYEYESDVISELEQMGVDYQSNEYFNMSIEVEEVYRKAKTFDEITKLEKQTSLYSVVGKEDVELGIEIRKIINKYNDRYKESANDERGND